MPHFPTVSRIFVVFCNKEMAWKIKFQHMTTTKRLKNIKFFILISGPGLELILILMLETMSLIKLDYPLSLKA